MKVVGSFLVRVLPAPTFPLLKPVLRSNWRVAGRGSGGGGGRQSKRRRSEGLVFTVTWLPICTALGIFVPAWLTKSKLGGTEISIYPLASRHSAVPGSNPKGRRWESGLAKLYSRIMISVRVWRLPNPNAEEEAGKRKPGLFLAALRSLVLKKPRCAVQKGRPPFSPLALPAKRSCPPL